MKYLAIVARNLAAAGYDVMGIDWRGMGSSEGERGYIESADVLQSDQWCMIFEACKKYKINQQTEPIYLMGYSMGAMIAAHMMNSVIGRSLLSGVLMVAPFFRDYDNKVANVYKFTLPMSYIHPRFSISSRGKV